MTDDDSFTRYWPNLADPRLGAAVVSVSDEFFGAAERIIDPLPPRFEPDLYDDHGKWMDGWESRRRRTPGHDHLVLVLPGPAEIHGVTLDTRYFTGNYPPGAELSAASGAGPLAAESADWTLIAPRLTLRGDALHHVPLRTPVAATSLKLSIFPDGGVARLRVHGAIVPDESYRKGDTGYDVASLLAGGRVVYCNDSHYGTPNRMLAPDAPLNMGDGWETRRRREPGNDWCIVELGRPALIREAIVDTAHFKGNYPAACSLSAALRPEWHRTAVDSALAALAADSESWAPLVVRNSLGPDQTHRFAALSPRASEPATHVRLDIYPDGGISRLRLIGRHVD
jgi:allantoicase